MGHADERTSRDETNDCERDCADAAKTSSCYALNIGSFWSFRLWCRN
jgi:hypothetical protein